MQVAQKSIVEFARNLPPGSLIPSHALKPAEFADSPFVSLVGWTTPETILAVGENPTVQMTSMLTEVVDQEICSGSIYLVHLLCELGAKEPALFETVINVSIPTVREDLEILAQQPLLAIFLVSESYQHQINVSLPSVGVDLLTMSAIAQERTGLGWTQEQFIEALYLLAEVAPSAKELSELPKRFGPYLRLERASGRSEVAMKSLGAPPKPQRKKWLGIF